MPQFSSKTDWLTQLETVNRLLQQDPNLTGQAIARHLGVSKAQASNLTTLHHLLDQVAIQKIRSFPSANKALGQSNPVAQLEASQQMSSSANKALGQSNPIAQLGASQQMSSSANKALGQSNPVAQLEASQQMPSFSLKSALALAGLTKAKSKDLNSLVHAALDVALAQKLPTVQIKALAAWMVAGNSAETFNPQPLRRETGYTNGNKPLAQSNSSANGNYHEPLAQPSLSPQLVVSAKASLDLKKLRQALEKAETERIQGTGTSAEEKLKAHILQTAETLKDGPAEGESLGKTIALDWLADVNLIKKLQSKRKKGQSLTAGEWCLLLVHKAGEGLKRVVIGIFKLIHWIGKLIVDALKELGIYKFAKAIFTLLAVAAAIWFGWEAFHYGVLRPVEMVWRKIYHPSIATEETPVTSPAPSSQSSPPQTPISLGLGHSSPAPRHEASVQRQTHQTLYANGLNNVPLAQSNHVARPVASRQMYHPAQPWTDEKTAPVWTQEDQKVLETEIESVASRGFLKDYVMRPDETMSGDLCVSRLQDMTNPDKYTMKIGGSTVTILSVSPSNQTLKIAYKNNDLFHVLDSGNGEVNVFWEDARVIHVNEIDLKDSKMYQFSLITAGAKFPLTIQCPAPDDLEHLVSTMEYFIRNSRLGHDTALAGMPYSFQGVRFRDDGVVDKLWADSPMDKAAVQLGDHLWSVGTAASEPSNRKALETALAASLPMTLYVASPADWDKATIAKNEGAPFRPKLRKVILSAN